MKRTKHNADIKADYEWEYFPHFPERKIHQGVTTDKTETSLFSAPPVVNWLHQSWGKMKTKTLEKTWLFVVSRNHWSEFIFVGNFLEKNEKSSHISLGAWYCSHLASVEPQFSCWSGHWRSGIESLNSGPEDELIISQSYHWSISDVLDVRHSKYLSIFGGVAQLTC